MLIVRDLNYYHVNNGLFLNWEPLISTFVFLVTRKWIAYFDYMMITEYWLPLMFTWDKKSFCQFEWPFRKWNTICNCFKYESNCTSLSGSPLHVISIISRNPPQITLLQSWYRVGQPNCPVRFSMNRAFSGKMYKIPKL